MRIRDISIHCFDLPLQQPFRISSGRWARPTTCWSGSNATPGWSAGGRPAPSSDHGRDAGDQPRPARGLRDLLVGQDPLAVDGFLRRAGSFLHTAPSVLAAFDIALHDLRGKAAGLPLFRLLGGENRTIRSDITADLDSPQNMAARVKGFLEAGYTTIKVKVGQDPDSDLARLEAVRGAAGPGCAIRIDANQGWTVPQAIAALRRMEPLRIEFRRAAGRRLGPGRDAGGPPAQPHPGHGRRVPLHAPPGHRAGPGRGPATTSTSS